MSTQERKLSIPCKLEAVKNARGRIVSYAATIAQLSAEATTPAQAVAALSALLINFLSKWVEPVVFWAPDGKEAWMTRTLASGGFGYGIHHREGLHHDREVFFGSWATFDEAFERMKKHYYQVHIEPMVLGIVAMGTDLRQYTCPHCQSAFVGHAPYLCKNPGCGYVRATGFAYEVKSTPPSAVSEPEQKIELTRAEERLAKLSLTEAVKEVCDRTGCRLPVAIQVVKDRRAKMGLDVFPEVPGAGELPPLNDEEQRSLISAKDCPGDQFQCKINAIRSYRARVGCGLKESVDIVNKFIKENIR